MPAVRHMVWKKGVLAPSPLYLDASILIGYWVEWLRGQVAYMAALEDAHRQRAATLITDHVLGGVTIQVSHLCLSESLWTLTGKLSALSSLLGTPRSPTELLGKFLDRNSQAMQAIRPFLVDCVDDTRRWATITGASEQDALSIVDSALDRLRDVTGVNDAFHLAVIEHVSAGSFATADHHFSKLTSLPRSLAVVTI